MKELLLNLWPYILEGGLVAFITSVITIKEVKRKATLENDGLSISNVKEIIELLREDNTLRKEEAAHLREMYEDERDKKENLLEDNTAAKMMMCIHMGCILRRPISGQGDQWFTTHRDDPALGCDYLPVNRLLQEYGKVAKKEEE